MLLCHFHKFLGPFWKQKRIWDTSTSRQVSDRDGFMLEIYLDHKFQWPQVGKNCESLAYEVVT